MSDPYLSIVVGVGGNLTKDLVERLMESTIKTVHLCEQTKLPAEIVIVEWNLPREESILTACTWHTGIIPIRIIRAGHLHSQVPNPHGFRYFEWYPKNIGIRRANGRFVLSTNPDDLFERGLFEFLSRRLLQDGYFYRAHRHDTRDGKVYRVCRETGCFPPDASEETIRTQLAPGACKWSADMLHYNASGDFMLMSKMDWFKIHGNPERDYNHSVDGQTVYLAHLKGLKQIVLPYPIYHPDHERTLNHAYAPHWDDKAPHTLENGEGWGFLGMQFDETIL